MVTFGFIGSRNNIFFPFESTISEVSKVLLVKRETGTDQA